MINLLNNKEVNVKSQYKSSEEKMSIIELIQLDKVWETRKYIFEFLNIEESRDLFIKLGHQCGTEKGAHNFLWGMITDSDLTQERIITLIEECIKISPTNVFKEESSGIYYVILRIKEGDLINSDMAGIEIPQTNVYEFYSRISARWLVTGYLVGYLSVILLRSVDYKLSKVREFGEDVIYLQLVIKKEEETELKKSSKKNTKEIRNNGKSLEMIWNQNCIDAYIEEKFVSLLKDFVNELNEFVIVFKDYRGEIINGSKKVGEILGLKSEELVGKEISEVLPLTKKDLKTLLKEAQRFHSVAIELPIKGKDGGNLDSGLKVTSVLLGNRYYYVCYPIKESSLGGNGSKVQEFIEQNWWNFLENFSLVLKNIFEIEEENQTLNYTKVDVITQESVQLSVNDDNGNKSKEDFTKVIIKELESI